MFAEHPIARFCPVRALEDYLTLRPKEGRWFFLTADGLAVPRFFVASALDRLTRWAGYSSSRYTTHSIRAGRASDLAAAGTPDHVIRSAGRWSSDAYRGYLRFRVLPDAEG